MDKPISSSTGIHRLDVDQAVMVVVDLQNDFCHPDGTFGRLHEDRERLDVAVAAIGTGVAGARAAGVPVVFVRTVHGDAHDSAEWNARFAEGIGGSYSTAVVNCLTDWGREFYEIEPDPQDLVVTKTRYSAFSSDEFRRTVSEIGRRSLLFCGVATHMCVEASVRSAVDSDYLASVLSDGCYSHCVADHERGLSTIGNGIGLVFDVADAIKAWRR